MVYLVFLVVKSPVDQVQQLDSALVHSRNLDATYLVAEYMLVVVPSELAASVAFAGVVRSCVLVDLGLVQHPYVYLSFVDLYESVMASSVVVERC